MYISVQKPLIYMATYEQLDGFLSVAQLYWTPASPSFLRYAHQKVQTGRRIEKAFTR